MDRRAHWERVYQTKRPDEVSWFQRRATLSLELIRSALEDRGAAILDVGGGTSTLVDDLLAEGYGDITVLDVSESALEEVRRRLGPQAEGVALIPGDILAVDLAAGSVALWHDRAVFHFLTDPSERERYLARIRRVLVPDGLILLATFAADGPTRCSGLEVARYDAQDLHRVFGDDFEMVASHREEHVTPGGVRQPFTYVLLRYRP